MLKQIGIVLLMVAAFLFIWGLDASGSFSSAFLRCFRGGASDPTVWRFAGGAAMGLMGLGLLFSAKNHHA